MADEEEPSRRPADVAVADAPADENGAARSQTRWDDEVGRETERGDGVVDGAALNRDDDDDGGDGVGLRFQVRRRADGRVLCR